MDDVEVDDDEEEDVDFEEDGDEMGIDPREREEAERLMKEQDERNREGRRRDLFRYFFFCTVTNLDVLECVRGMMRVIGNEMDLILAR